MKLKKKDIRFLLIFCILISILSCSNESKVKSVNDLPNIVFILADDLGWGDLGCYGHPYAKTPHIDNLAKAGILFKKCYASGVSCCPSRTALMTGKHPATFNKYMASNGFGDNVTITELLKNAGYKTAHVGKWHIGPINETDKNPYGIDHIILKAGRRDSPKGKDANIFDWAINFIENNNNHPFYINIWTHTVHFPLKPPENMLMHFNEIEVDKKQFGSWFNQEKLQVLENEGKNIDNAMKMYLAELYTLDHNIGRLIQSLKEQNLEQNTIIIFSSDQGPAPVYIHNKKSIDIKENRLNMLGYAGGLRGGKHSLYEGGVRVPFIVKWPEKIPNNYIDDNSVISGLDFLPTICSIVEIEYEKDSFDGEDKSNVWYGVPEKRKTPLYWKRHKGTAISILDNQWKMYKEVGGQVALYNVEEDPFEEKEILVENDSIAQSLLSKIDNWNKVLPETE